MKKNWLTGLVVAAGLLWLLYGCASTRLPAAPEGATLLNVYPIRCGSAVLVMKIYDTNPATKAGVGVVTGPKGEPILVIVQNDNGEVFVYLHSATGGVRRMTEAEWVASGLDACSVYETRVAAE